jgi:hypothetical protein
MVAKVFGTRREGDDAGQLVSGGHWQACFLESGMCRCVVASCVGFFVKTPVWNGIVCTLCG